MARSEDAGPPMRVLLVEDDVPYAELVMAMLADELPDAELDCAVSLADARTALSVEPDIVIADLSLPDAEGLEVVGALRLACPDTAVIVLSRHDDDEFALDAIAAGADDCLVKGRHDAAQLGTAVRRAVQRVRAHAVRQRRERFAASLLEANDGPTCAVDGSGVVVSVNASWRAFTTANSGEPLLCGVGVDYLAACDDAVGERYDGAAEVADGLRKVLSGELDGFEHEYSCHGPAQQRWFSVRISPQPSGGGAVVRHVDVTASRLAERARSRRLLHDPVTGLPNTVLLADRLEQALAEGGRSGLLVAVALVDVDQADQVLGEHGPQALDALLVEVADRLTGCLRDGDTLAQLGGPRFAVVWRDVASVGDADVLADQLPAAFRTPCRPLGMPVTVTTSVGVAVDQWAQTADELLLAAAAAMHDGLRRGTGQVQRAATVSAPRRRTEAALREAMALDQLVVHYQPVVDLGQGAVVGVEALVRWQHPVDGLIPPDDFIPVAESGGLIVALGAIVLEQACRQAVRWHAAGLRLQVAVNLSTRQVAHPDLLRTVARVLRETGLEPEHLVLEVTESAVMEDAEAAATTLSAIAALGVGLSIDDFGTGYSSLVYLKRYPIRALKVDRSFIGGMGASARDDAIVASVIGLARAVGGSCIAEGIETAEQYAALVSLGCDFGQGWLFGRAQPAQDLPAAVLRAEAVLRVLRASVPVSGAERDHAGQQRDQAAEDRDQAGDERDQAGNERDQVADRRDEVAQRRDLKASERDQVGDDRDQAGEQRDLAGTRRDEAADRRDERADARDSVADRRDDAADERDLAAELGESRRDERVDARQVLRAVQARRAAASDREQASEDRQAGASERSQAERDRGTALADRGFGAGSRVRAVHDRDTALADRGAGAGDRTSAERDRDTALADRGAGGGERTSSEHDRQTAGNDRGASARDRLQASVDGLTGVYRRAPGLVELTREVQRAHRTRQPLVVAFVDVDGLKAVNDTQGHAAGDQALRELARTLLSALRSYDLVVRYGGDEFVCALAGVDLEEAGHRMASLHAQLATAPSGVSVSVGLAALRDGESAEDLVVRADRELYRGRLGRASTQ